MTMFFIGPWYMGTKVLIMATGNIRVLRSESLILVNISNKVQVQNPWPWFLDLTGYQGQSPYHGSLHGVRAQGQTNCLFDKLQIL